MLLLERDHSVHDTDSLLHEFLLVFHKSCVIRVHQLIAYVKSQEVCLPLYRRMCQMDKDGKKLVADKDKKAADKKAVETKKSETEKKAA